MNSFYETLLPWHLCTVLPCIPLGAYLLLSKKGDKKHRLFGRLYLFLMGTTAIISLFMPALLGPRVFDHFGYIHLFCVLTLWTVPVAYISARKRDIARHQRSMWLLYIGAILLAGGFTLMPGRYLHELIF